MDAATVLERAADLIEQRGWLQHTLGDFARGYCALGAIIAAREDDLTGDEYGVLCSASGGSVSSWNNAPERTKEEVIALLRAVAATERARAAMPVPAECEAVHA